MTKDEEKVLRYLYEHKDSEGEREVSDICVGTGLSRQVVRKTLRELQEKKMVGGGPPDLLQQVMAALKDQDKNFEPTDPGYAEHVILLASAISKADEQFLADELGYDIEFVSLVGSRLRSAGIWSGNELSEDSRKEWCEEGGGTSFYLDGAVATGNLKVTGKNEKGDRLFQMTEAGETQAAGIIKRMAEKKRPE